MSGIEYILTPFVLRPAIATALRMLDNACVGISGHRVGAAVIAANKDRQVRIFGGCNIELATSKVWHAEQVALAKAISEGYRQIDACIVTSTHKDQQAAMCGYCMQDFMYANPKCVIVVLNPDGTEKLRTTVEERNGKYAYRGLGKLNPNNSA